MSLWKFTSLTALASVCVALTACGSAPIPVANNFEYTVQNKVRSAGHWDLLAKDVVAQTTATLKQVGVAAHTPLSVKLPRQPSAFDEGFHSFVTTKLVQSGMTVLIPPNDTDLQLTYDT